MQPTANQVWGDPLRPETWVWFTKGMGMFLCPNWKDLPTKYSPTWHAYPEEAARWAADHGYVDITALIRGEVG